MSIQASWPRYHLGWYLGATAVQRDTIRTSAQEELLEQLQLRSPRLMRGGSKELMQQVALVQTTYIFKCCSAGACDARW